MKKISESAVRRLSLYLRFLQEADAAGKDTISSGQLAERGGATSAQVRKDLSLFGSFGKRGMGYPVPELLAEIRQILGLTRVWNVALVGAGILLVAPIAGAVYLLAILPIIELLRRLVAGRTEPE